MRPTELTNFTVWGRQWFADGWDGLRSFCQGHGIAGIELLGSGATVDTAPPQDLVYGIHLRSLGNWLPLVGLDVVELGHGARRYSGLASYEDLVSRRAQELREMSVFSPAYMVWHACCAPTPQVFGGEEQLTATRFLSRLADLVRDVVSVFRPPCTLCFENCFGVGFEPDAPGRAKAFLEAMEGLPVALCLDTGHLLNTRRDLADPHRACEWLLEVAAALTQVGARIGTMHLHWTDPALVPPEAWRMARELVPAGPETAERVEQVTAFYAACDQHRPLVDPLVRQVVAAARPEFVVHELGAMSLQDHSDWLVAQASALRGGWR